MHLVVLVAVRTVVEHPDAVEQGDVEAIAQLERGGGQHRLVVLSVDANERVGLLDAGAQYAAGAAQVDGVPHPQAAVGHEGGGERVTGVAREGRAVDGEPDRLGAVETPAALEPAPLAVLVLGHAPTSFVASGAFGRPSGRAWSRRYTWVIS